MPARKSPSMITLNFQLKRAITNATMEDRNSARITDGIVMIAELIYLRIFQSPDWGLAAAISVVLVIIMAALMLALPQLILALPATVEGATTGHYLVDRLRPLSIPVTRLAQGVPMGGALDVLDDGTLAAALRARRPA